MEEKKEKARYGLRDYVYEHLREKIKKGEIDHTEIMTINQLCHELDISRTPIREAIAQLDNEGFVTILPQRGIKIRQLNFKEFLDIYQILGALESTVILSVANLIGKKEISEMKMFDKKMNEALKRNNDEKYFKYNLLFHQVYLDLSENQLLLNYVNTLKLRLYDFSGIPYDDKWKKDNSREHKTFLNMLEMKKIKKASEFLRDVHWTKYPKTYFDSNGDRIKKDWRKK